MLSRRWRRASPCSSLHGDAGRGGRGTCAGGGALPGVRACARRRCGADRRGGGGRRGGRVGAVHGGFVRRVLGEAPGRRAHGLRRRGREHRRRRARGRRGADAWRGLRPRPRSDRARGGRCRCGEQRRRAGRAGARGAPRCGSLPGCGDRAGLHGALPRRWGRRRRRAGHRPVYRCAVPARARRGRPRRRRGGGTRGGAHGHRPRHLPRAVQAARAARVLEQAARCLRRGGGASPRSARGMLGADALGARPVGEHAAGDDPGLRRRARRRRPGDAARLRRGVGHGLAAGTASGAQHRPGAARGEPGSVASPIPVVARTTWSR